MTAMDTQKIMLWVLISLLPAGAAGIYFFGSGILGIIAVSVISCVAAELIWQRIAGQPETIHDLSAVVTGLLIAYNVPPSIPLWMPAIGGFFAMIIVKHFFGGIGQNIVNPALAARAMMLICWPVAMTTWTMPGPDAVSGPTLLGIMKRAGGLAEMIAAGSLPDVNTLIGDAFVGNIAGCIGETSAIALIIGGIILIAKKIITWHIPVIYIATVAVLSFAFGRDGGPALEVLVGGLMLGAIFMATDYTTSPMTAKGKVIFAIGCGLLTTLIRTFGGYPEGVSYSILIMNITVPIIDRFTAPRILGEAKSRVQF